VHISHGIFALKWKGRCVRSNAAALKYTESVSIEDTGADLDKCGSGCAGVSCDSNTKMWRAQINTKASDGKSKQRHLGNFVNEVDAALAYDQAAREHHKDKAKLNFPGPQPQVALSKTPRGASSQYRGKDRCTYALLPTFDGL
jgi:hypothetical protein